MTLLPTNMTAVFYALGTVFSLVCTNTDTNLIPLLTALGSHPTESEYVTFSNDAPVASSLCSSLIINTTDLTTFSAGVLSNILKYFGITHHLYGYAKPLYGWEMTQVETLTVIIQLTEILFRHSLFHGTIANTKIAFMSGLTQNISLCGHTNEGGLVREILRKMRFEQPFGLLTCPTTEVDPLPYY